MLIIVNILAWIRSRAEMSDELTPGAEGSTLELMGTESDWELHGSTPVG